MSIQLIDSSGYKSNVSLARLMDHAKLGLNLKKLLSKINKEDYPDAVFIGYPPIEPAYVMSKWLSKRNIPYIVDVKDKWPDIYFRCFSREIEVTR